MLKQFKVPAFSVVYISIPVEDRLNYKRGIRKKLIPLPHLQSTVLIQTANGRDFELYLNSTLHLSQMQRQIFANSHQTRMLGWQLGAQLEVATYYTFNSYLLSN